MLLFFCSSFGFEQKHHFFTNDKKKQKITKHRTPLKNQENRIMYYLFCVCDKGEKGEKGDRGSEGAMGAVSAVTSVAACAGFLAACALAVTQCQGYAAAALAAEGAVVGGTAGKI